MNSFGEFGGECLATAVKPPLFQFAKMFMAIDTADRELRESECCAIDVVFFGVFDELVGRVLEDLQLRAVARRSAAHEPLHFAKRPHRLSVRGNAFKVGFSDADQDLLGVVEFPPHPDGGFLG